MPTNLKEFSINLGRLKSLARDKAIQLQQKIALQVLRGVVLRSPVKTGRFRGNWLVSTGSPVAYSVATMDPSGQATISLGANTIAALRELGVVWISNNLVYGPALESGHSKQAPAGMVAVTVASVRAQFKV